jgi:hypothetical protein
MNFLKYIIILLFFISCNNKDTKIEKNKYEILNLIYSDFSKHQMEFFVFPTKQLLDLTDDIDHKRLLLDTNYKDSLHDQLYSTKISKIDSLLKIEKYTSNKENQQVFAFDLKMKKYRNLKDRERTKNKTGFENLYKNFVKSEKIDSLSIRKILPKNNDLIVECKKELLKVKVGVEFRKFDVLISFSDIVFNNNYSKAIIIGVRVFNGTDSHSLIYFLEKENGKWKKMFEQIP